MLALSELIELKDQKTADGSCDEFPSLKQVLKNRFARERSEAASKGNLVRSNTRSEQPKSTKQSVIGVCQLFFSRCKKNGGNKVGTNIDSLTERFEEDIEPNIRQNDQSQEASIEELEITTDSQRESNEMQRLKKLYCKISVNYFELDNPVRQFTIRVIEWPWFDRFIIFLIALNSLFLGIMDYTWARETENDPPPIGNWLVEQSEVYFTFFFTVECVFKIISLGLILNKGCYLRDGWNWLDFTVVVTALIQNLPGVQNVSSLRTFRLFRPLRSLSAVPSMKVLVNTLFLSFTQLTNIMILDIFFILTFAMFGQQMWNGIVHYRCRKTKYPVDGDWEVVEDDNRLCGAFHQCKEGTYCGSLFETTLVDENGQLKKYELKVENLYRDTFIRELNFGITNFDSIENSFLTIFQCTTLEGWSRVMMMIQDSYSIFTSSVFFIVLVIICSYFLLNLTVAVMLDNFKQLNQESTDKVLLKYEQNQLKLQELKKINSIMELKNRFTLKQRIKVFFKNVCFKNPGEPKYDPEDGKSRYRFILCRLCWKIINVPIFNSIIMLLIISNTIILATDQYPKPELDLIASTNMYFTISFTAECILKLIGLTFEDFTKDRFNIFDLVIVISSIVELMLSDTSGGVVSALRAFRLLRLIKLARSNHTLKCLLDSIAHTIAAIINFLVLLAILVYVFALLGMKMFAGHFKFDEDGKFEKENGIVPRQNFDSLPWSLITVFQILVLDQWNEVMYMSLQSVGGASVIYFIFLVLVGNFIMLNLFLAILLGNFEQASCMIRSRDQAKLLREYQGIDIGSDNEDNSSDPPAEIESARKSKGDEEKPELTPDDQPGLDLQLNETIKNVDEEKKIKDTEMNEAESLEIIEDDADKIDFGKPAPSPIENQAFGDIVTRLNSDLKEVNPPEEEIECSEFKVEKVAEGSGSEQAQSQSQVEDDQAGGIVKSAEQSLVAPAPNTETKAHMNNLDSVREKIQPLQIQEPSFAPASVMGAGLMPKHEAIEQSQAAKPSMNLANVLQGLQNKRVPREEKESSFNSSLEMQEVLMQQIKEYNVTSGLNQGIFDYQKSEKEITVNANDKFLKLLPQKVQVLGTEEDEDKNIDTQRNLLNKESHRFQGEGSSQEAELLGKPNNNNLKMPNELQNIIDDVEEQSEDQDEVRPMPMSQKILLHMSESSLLIFHRESCFRKFLIRLTVPQPKKDQQQKDQILSALQNYGQDEDEDSIVADENIEDHDYKNGAAAEDDMLSLKDQKTPENHEVKGNIANTLHMSFGNDSPDHGDEKKLQKFKVSTNSGIAYDDRNDGENFKVELDTDALLQKINNFIDKGGEPRDIRMVIDNERDVIERQIANMLNQGVIEVRQQQRFQKNLATQIEAFEVQHWENSLSKLRFRNKVRVTHKFLKSKIFFLNWSLNELFENIIYLCILISMILLIVANPQLDPEGGFAIGVNQVEGVISIIYLTEAILRIFALGFFNSSIPGQKGYIRSGSNQIDFFVSVICDVTLMLSEKIAKNPLVTISMGQTFKYQDTLKSFKVLRTLRALRPLRVISKSDGLKLAVGSLYGALPAILNGLIVCGLIVFIYAIIGISYFKGQFQHCSIRIESDPEMNDIANCEKHGGTWTKYARNFDNITEAIPVLFEIITTEGWLEVMYYAIDSRGEGTEPGKNENTVYALFFISFIVTGNIFIMNLFVGIVIDKFNRLKEKMSGYLLMTRHQKEWIEKEKQMVRLVIEPLKSPPEEKTKLYCYNLSLDQNFENFISVCIILSTLQMALRYYQMEARYVYYLDLLSYLLTMVYNIEAVIKMIALDLSYFSNSWNRFDFFIVIVADLSIIVDATESETEFIKILKIVKALRIMRIFRLVRVSRNLSVLVDSLIIILPSIANVGSLIMLLFFIFSVIGMNMFANVIHQEEINENMNFQSFGMALIILMRCATGEGWNKIMRELAIAPHTTVLQRQVHGETREITCEPVLSHAKLMSDGPIECGNQGSYIFFVIFIMVIQTTMLNLFIAVVLEGFSSTNKEHTGVVTSKHYSQFISHWITYDEDATGWIKLEDLIFFLYELNQPLGRKNEFDEDISDFLEKEEDYCKRQSKILDQDKRFAVNVGRNMVVPFKKTMKLLSSISIPVFEDPKRIGQYRCHFKHVIKRMTYLAMQRGIEKFDPSGIQQKHLRSLKRQWEIVYPDLKKYQPMQKYYSGHIWAAIFISSCFKNVINNKRLNEQEFAFNWALKEKQDRESKEEEEKKNQDIEQLKAKKKERKLIKRNRLKTEMALRDNLKTMMEGPDAANKRLAEVGPTSSSPQGKLSEIKTSAPGNLSHFQLTANIQSPMTSQAMKQQSLGEKNSKYQSLYCKHKKIEDEELYQCNQKARDENKQQEKPKQLAKGEIVLASYMNNEVLNGEKIFSKLQQAYRIDMPQDSYELVEKINQTMGNALAEKVKTKEEENKEKIKVNSDPQRIDLLRSTWHVSDPGVNYKMLQWMKTRELKEQLNDLHKQQQNKNEINVEDQNRDIQKQIIIEEEQKQVDTDERGGEVFQVAQDAIRVTKPGAPNIAQSMQINRLTFGLPKVEKQPTEDEDKNKD